MAPGDVTIVGPYGTTTAGLTLADTALTAISSGVASDKVQIIHQINNMGFFILWVEGA